MQSVATKVDLSSPTAFGQRMKARLQDLIDNPYSFVPSYAERYQTFLKHCESLTPHQSYAMTMLLGPDSARGYAKVPNTFGTTFPEANAVDLTEQVGWYYFAGNVKGKNGDEYGILFMMFQYTLLPPPIAEQFGMTPLQNQIVDVQLAITKRGSRMHQAAPPLFAGTSGDIEIADRLFVRAGNNVVDTPSKDQLFPMTLRASGVDLGAAPVPLSIDITLSSGSGYLLQGADGCEPCAGGIGTRYYSIPQLVVDGAKSRLTIGDETVEIESGMLWMDHQWGTGMVPDGASTVEVLRAAANLSAPSPDGWDFFVMNFADGSAMTLNHLHTNDDLPWMNQSGADAPPPRPPVSVVGKYMDRFGTPFNVSGDVTVTEWARGVTSPDPAKYPVSNVWFPHGWTFDLNAAVLPKRLRNLRFEPMSEDPCAMFFANGSQYVEAPITVFDADGAECGRGYCEAVNYADANATTASLAGLPAELAPTLGPIPPSADLKALSELEVAANQAQLNQAIACGSFPPAARPGSCP